MIDKLPYWLRRVGARGFLMLVCAYIWTWLGIGNYRDVPNPRPYIVHFMIDGHVRALMWWFGPLVAVATAGFKKWNLLGLFCLSLMPLFVIASYTASYLSWYKPGGSPGYVDGWYSAGIYLALPALVLAAALIPEPPSRDVLVEILEESP